MRRSRVLTLAALVIALVLGGYFFVHKRGGDASAAPQQAAGGGRHGGRFGGDGGPVPVSAVAVKKQDVPIYLDGLGTVVAFNTVTLRAQVGGQLVQVPFREGDEVKAGDLIAQVDPRTYQAALDQALAKKAQDEATLGSAKLDLKRYLDLLPDGYVSAQQVDQQRALIKQDEALIQADQAAIETARVNLSYTHISAPFDGIVGIRQVDVGNLVSSGDATGIAVLTQVKPISVTFTLPEQSLNEIRAADNQALSVIALNRENQQPLAQGTLSVVDNQIDQSTGTIKLKATFANEDRKLWPGQFVNVRLLVRTRKDGLVIPAPAVQRGPNGSFVYTIKPDQSVEMRPIQLAQTEDNLALIDGGLQEGEQVVTDGQYRLQPGSKVQLSEAPGPSPPAAGAGSGDQAQGQRGGDQAQGQRHNRRKSDDGSPPAPPAGQ